MSRSLHLVFLILFSGNAFAGAWKYADNQYGSGYIFYSANDACGYYNTHLTSDTGSPQTYTTAVTSYATSSASFGNCQNSYGSLGGAWSGVYFADATAPVTCPAFGTSKSGNYTWPGGSATACIGGCQYSPQQGSSSSNAAGQTRVFATGLNSMGTACGVADTAPDGTPADVPGPPTCPSGQTLQGIEDFGVVGTHCVSSTPPDPNTPECPKGQHVGGLTDGVARCISDDPPKSDPQCSTGTHLASGVCVSDSNPPVICAKGSSPSTVGGVSVCTPSPTQSETGGVATMNPDGSTSTTSKSSSCSGGVCTIVQTTGGTNAPAAGGAAGSGTPKASATTTTTEPQQDFCKENPLSTLCSTSTFNGSCVNGQASITATGDAIQTAIAREEVQKRCTDEKNQADVLSNSRYNMAVQTLAGSDPLAGSIPTVGNATVVNVPTGSSDGFLSGGGQCLPNTTVPIGTSSITISFDNICDKLVVFRYALQAIGGLIAFRIVSRAVTGS